MSSRLETWVCKSTCPARCFPHIQQIPARFSCVSSTWRSAAMCQHSRPSVSQSWHWLHITHIPALKTQDTHRTIMHSICLRSMEGRQGQNSLNGRREISPCEHALFVCTSLVYIDMHILAMLRWQVLPCFFGTSKDAQF